MALSPPALAYPRSFRDRYGEKTIALFRSRRARARSQGVAARLSFWLTILTDLAGAASRERLESWQGRSKTARRKKSGIDALLQDQRLSLRRILDAPGFTAMAVLIVGLGIGVNVAVFGVVEGILFRPLDQVPYAPRLFAVARTAGEASLSWR